MSQTKTYSLDILTPQRQFFSGEVEALTIRPPDGSLTVLAGHAPLIAPFGPGCLGIKTEGEWREAFHSEGFMEVSRTQVVIFAQLCEWADEIDSGEALEEKQRAEELLRQKQSFNEHRLAEIALARAMARLKISQQRINLK